MMRLSLVAHLGADMICSINGRESDFISIRYMLFPDAISLEILSSEESTLRAYFEGTLSDEDELTITLTSELTRSVRSGSRISPPVSRKGKRANAIQLHVEGQEIFEIKVGSSDFCEISFAINNQSNTYQANVAHGATATGLAENTGFELTGPGESRIVPLELARPE